MEKIYFNKTNTPDKIIIASEILKDGGILLHPTENLYGFGASIFCSKTIHKISRIKQRENQKGYIVLISSLQQLEMLSDGRCMGEKQKKTISKYWPGALTIIFRAKKKYWNHPFCKDTTVAIRLVGNPIIRNIIAKSGNPIISTSVNLSGKNASVSEDYIENKFGSLVDGFVIDNVHKFSSVPSTVIKFEKNELKILRQGAVTLS